MPANAQRTRDEWLEADLLARLKEEELKAAWAAFGRGHAEPPSDELIREAAKLRALADASLTVAVAALNPRRSSPIKD